MAHLVNQGLIRNAQHPGKSCTANLLVFQDIVTKSADEGKPMVLIFWDFLKAFNKVPKERLLAKLEAKV